jgi:ZF-HD class homeobox domain-containing protein
MNNSFSRNLVMRYKECLKNHAAAIGGNATDGCGEFMPSGDEGTMESLKCSACNCHRNFHRKETELSDYHPSPLIGHPTKPMIMSYKSGSVVPSESDDYGSGDVAIRPAEKAIIRKRFRTKFTKEQKEKMLSFAEKAGWRMQKLEESVVQHFCQEIGINRRVLKVWMHNNKHSLANKNSSS